VSETPRSSLGVVVMEFTKAQMEWFLYEVFAATAFKNCIVGRPVKGESPDFQCKLSDGTTIGLEVTESIPENFALMRKAHNSIAGKDFSTAEIKQGIINDKNYAPLLKKGHSKEVTILGSEGSTLFFPYPKGPMINTDIWHKTLQNKIIEQVVKKLGKLNNRLYDTSIKNYLVVGHPHSLSLKDQSDRDYILNEINSKNFQNHFGCIYIYAIDSLIEFKYNQQYSDSRTFDVSTEHYIKLQQKVVNEVNG
jgi:hypothetical protein